MNLDVDGYICMYIDTGQYVSKFKVLRMWRWTYSTVDVSVDVDLDVHTAQHMQRDRDVDVDIQYLLYCMLHIFGC